MDSKLTKNFAEKVSGKILGTLLMLTVASFFYAPAFAPKAQAIFGIVDTSITTDVAALAKRLIDAAAQVYARRIIDNMVKSTITWANTGFEGNPAYVTNPKRYFGKIGEGVITDAISGSNLGFVCSPFQAQIKLSLVQQYVQEYQPQCTFDQIGRNLTDFYKSFSAGGWGAWFDMTQQDNNNPYGSYINIKSNIDSRLANELGLAQTDRQISSGFLSYKPCLAKNPKIPDDVIEDYLNGVVPEENVTFTYGKFDLDKPAGTCLDYGDVVTPGSVIAKQLNDTLPTGMNKLVNATQVDQLVGAFASGLLQRYVFGPKGLFSSKYNDSFNAGADSSTLKMPEFGWITCAKEGEQCVFDGEEKVRYGAAGTYIELTLTDGAKCSSDVFGAVKLPAQFNVVPKTCAYYGQTRGVVVEGQGSTNWITCASEGGTCSFPGTKQVRFGANGIYNIGTAENNVKCAISSFGGDPVPGIAKKCQYRGIGTVNNPDGQPIALSCSPDKTFVNTNALVTWAVNSAPTTTASYVWSGDDVSSDATSDTLALKYTSEGDKKASVSALDADQNTIDTVSCGSIKVSDSTQETNP
ncbi:hypothetical protein KW800_01015 [Candidatus Parcubacteria bacterium]|nr:hypothetical protein [Candidatus Parcubacteria bacterium]